jgi:LytS/YehU family sensor histidine kinase
MQYEALKNQVNPHFLFNSLNALSSLIYENPGKAVEFINRLSDVYRYVLDSKDKEAVPLSEELTFVRSYLFLLKARFENNLVAETNISEEKGYVPPMALQMLIENAVKHNEISDEHPLKISVFEKDQYIYVKNNVQLKVRMNNIPPVPLDRGGRAQNLTLEGKENPGNEANKGNRRISAHQPRRAGMQGDGAIIPPRRDSDGPEYREGFNENTQGIGLKNIESRYSILSDNPVKIERSEEVFCIGLPILQIV